ncbi:hypothetical protein M446_1817 [Methylobacterium sp. 4-46]|uniref:hypothetical protein n=1 Tax=unclassified Methylobacterium TaxID=2615210 RepID=UPI000165C8EE|nr:MULTISPECIES: hypothetical protein [Methylobacterium]ACA16302.1 hypothetical protein M446_1817 [Methylobacterium sp. 4-46]WFT82010.1 hypothetical protein QA634_09180 [Methylobacterium nodulans]
MRLALLALAGLIAAPALAGDAAPPGRDDRQALPAGQSPVSQTDRSHEGPGPERAPGRPTVDRTGRPEPTAPKVPR